MNKRLISMALVLALVLALAATGRGQTLPAPEAAPAAPVSAGVASPVPYVFPSPTVRSPYPIISLPQSSPPPACAPNEDNNGNLLRGDPLLDWSPWVTGSGWFGALEVDPVGPAVKNQLNAPVTVGGVTSTVALPSAHLNWTAIPHIEVGYRLQQGAGELLASYRGIYSAGTSTIAGLDAAGNLAPLSSHLSLTVIDLDYASRENALGPLWDMKWRAGARIATAFFDSTATTPLLSQHESNNFTGGGVHFALNLKRRIGQTGFAVVGQLDGGSVLGNVRQLYEETIFGVGNGQTRAAAVEPVPTLEVRFGVDYAPPQLPGVRLSTGYLFERWWNIGNTNLGNNGEITYQGLYLRGEWRY